MCIQALAVAMFSTASFAQEAEQPTLVPTRPELFAFTPIEALGADVVRFSSRPPGGRWGYVFEMTRSTDPSFAPHGVGRIVFLVRHSDTEWEQWGELPVELVGYEYPRVVAAFDRALSEGGPPRDQRTVELSDGGILICGEDYGYLLERRVEGRTQELDGNCGNHPNLDIALMIEGIIYRNSP